MQLSKAPQDKYEEKSCLGTSNYLKANNILNIDKEELIKNR